MQFGYRLYRPSWAAVHVWLANAGLAGLSLGLALRIHGIAGAGLLLAAGGVLASVGAYAFAVNIGLSTRTKSKDPVSAAATGRKLPTVGTD
ncbi:hypothetical protein BH23GEM2_BH23GEM2_01500 [soil metagenome]